MPDPSSPSTIGIGMPVCEPSYACRQLWHTPVATILTRTSPNPGSSSSISIICIRSLGLSSTGAVINMVCVLFRDGGRRTAPMRFPVPHLRVA